MEMIKREEKRVPSITSGFIRAISYKSYQNQSDTEGEQKKKEKKPTAQSQNTD